MKRKKMNPLAIGQEGPRPEDVKINRQLALYNKTGNALALWSVLSICGANKRPLPEDVAEFFKEMADKLLALATAKNSDARDLTVDIVLGTKNEGGGRSAFRRYAEAMEERELHDEIDAAMADRVLDGPSTQLDIFTEVANRHNKSLEYVKRSYEQANKDMGAFKIAAVVATKNFEEIADLRDRKRTT